MSPSGSGGKRATGSEFLSPSGHRSTSWSPRPRPGWGGSRKAGAGPVADPGRCWCRGGARRCSWRLTRCRCCPGCRRTCWSGWTSISWSGSVRSPRSAKASSARSLVDEGGRSRPRVGASTPARCSRRKSKRNTDWSIPLPPTPTIWASCMPCSGSSPGPWATGCAGAVWLPGDSASPPNMPTGPTAHGGWPSPQRRWMPSSGLPPAARWRWP
jgi:hypothetical protein